MLPAICLSVLLVNPYEYDGIPLRKLAKIYESYLYYPVKEEELKTHGAYSAKSLPLYMKLLTTEPDAQELLPSRTWIKLRIGACALIPKAAGDKREFVPVGIGLLSHSNPAFRSTARIMLLEIATPDDIPKLKAVIDPDAPKKLDTLVQAAKVLSVIGGKDEVTYLETLLDSKHVKGDKYATEHVAGSLDYLKRLLDEKATPPEKK
jgi:hypothetical protein